MEVLAPSRTPKNQILLSDMSISSSLSLDASYGDPTVIDGDLVIQMTDASWTCFERSLA